MAQQVACDDRDEVSSGTQLHAVARTLMALTSSTNLDINKYIALFDNQAPPRTAALPYGYHGEQVYWMS